MSYATVVNGRPDEQHTDPDNPFGFDPKTLEDPNLYAAEVDARTIILVAPQAKHFVPDSVSLKAVLEVDDFKYHKIVSFSRTGDNRWTIMVNSIILAEKFNNTTMRIGDIVYRFSGIHEATLITIQIDERIHNKLIIEKLNDSCEIINIKHKYHIFAKNIRTNKRVILIRWKKDVTRLTKISILGRSYQLYYKGMKAKIANDNVQPENNSATNTIATSSIRQTSMETNINNQTTVQDTTIRETVTKDKEVVPNNSKDFEYKSLAQQEPFKSSNNFKKESKNSDEINVDATKPSNPLLNDAGLTTNQVSQIRNQIFMKRKFDNRTDEIEHLVGPLMFMCDVQWRRTILDYIDDLEIKHIPDIQTILKTYLMNHYDKENTPETMLKSIGFKGDSIHFQKTIISKYLRQPKPKYDPNW